MYHAHEFLATDALEQLCAALPHERGDAHRLLARYAGGEVSKRNYAGLHVALCLLWADTAGEAERLLSRRIGARPGAAAQLLAGCVNDGIFSAVKDATYLYRKGWLGDDQRFYRVGRALAWDSEFHRSCARISAAHRPVLLAAIRVCHRRSAGGGGAGTLSKRSLPYIAAMLCEPGAERDFRLAALASRRPARDHAALMDRAQRFINRACELLRIRAQADEQLAKSRPPARPAPARREPAAKARGQFYQRLRPFRAVTASRAGREARS